MKKLLLLLLLPLSSLSALELINIEPLKTATGLLTLSLSKDHENRLALLATGWDMFDNDLVIAANKERGASWVLSDLEKTPNAFFYASDIYRVEGNNRMFAYWDCEYESEDRLHYSILSEDGKWLGPYDAGRSPNIKELLYFRDEVIAIDPYLEHLTHMPVNGGAIYHSTPRTAPSKYFWQEDGVCVRSASGDDLCALWLEPKSHSNNDYLLCFSRYLGEGVWSKPESPCHLPQVRILGANMASKEELILAVSTDNEIYLIAYRQGRWSVSFPLAHKYVPFETANANSDPQGNNMLVWEEKGKLHSAYLRFGGEWERADLESSEADDPCLTSDSQGNFLLIWTEGEKSSMKASLWSTYTHSWSIPQTLTHSVNCPELVILEDGHAVVAWYKMSYDDDQLMVADLMYAEMDSRFGNSTPQI